LVLNNPTYKDAITEHRPEEMLYVLGSSSLPFLKKVNATDGSPMWLKTLRPTLPETENLSITHFEIDSIQFYRTVVAVSGRVQMAFSPEKNPIALMQSPPFSISVGSEESQQKTKTVRLISR